MSTCAVRTHGSSSMAIECEAVFFTKIFNPRKINEIMQKRVRSKRPLLITILCIIGFFIYIGRILGWLYVQFFVNLDVATTAGLNLSFFYLEPFLHILGFVLLLFIWRMNKRALILFTILNVIEIIIIYSMPGIIHIRNIIPVVVLTTLFYIKFKEFK